MDRERGKRRPFEDPPHLWLAQPAQSSALETTQLKLSIQGRLAIISGKKSKRITFIICRANLIDIPRILRLNLLNITESISILLFGKTNRHIRSTSLFPIPYSFNIYACASFNDNKPLLSVSTI